MEVWSLLFSVADNSGAVKSAAGGREERTRGKSQCKNLCT